RVVDPIAQTFMFEKDQLLTTLGVYFAVKDKKHDVTIQIRETDNGYPTNIILAEKVITHEDIEISKDSSKETKIVFDDPVYCKADTQYAFTVLTNSSFASMFVEELGKKDLLTKAMVVKNPYIPGVMFSSSNALAWTAHQTKNIKFNMYCNTFEPESVIYFNALNGIDYDRIALLADTSVPIDCSLTWEYSSDGGVNWLPLAINTDTDLSKPIDNITIRAIFKAKENISPAVDLDSLLFTGAKNKEESSYITRNIELDKEYTSVKIIADVFAPSGTGVVFYYATDINGEEPNVKQVGGYIEYTYTATETNAKNFRAKVALTTNDTTVRPKVKNLKCILK
ncbi:MAG: hypothetical protein Q4Q13_07285, partial [Vagococcus sp.]|nr:hypothetical protein [Vagococcus sp.]